MKIVMLGGSAVGKTTVMVSTYGMMGSTGQFQGFHVHCKSEPVHKKLLNAYRDFKAKGAYPDSTVKMETYEYTFKVDSQEIMDFSLIDIRGESIRDYDNKELLQELTDADAIMLFFNGQDVVNDTDLEDDFFDIFSLLNAAVSKNPKNRLFMPIITQMDRFLPIDEETVNKIVKFSEPLLKMVEKNDSIAYRLVPTACNPSCMMDLDYMMVALMHFGYHQDYSQKAEALVQKYADLKAEYDKSLGIMDLFGLDERRNRVRREMKELEPVKDFILNVMTPIDERMSKFIDDYTLFSYASPVPQKKTGKSENTGGKNIFDL